MAALGVQTCTGNLSEIVSGSVRRPTPLGGVFACRNVRRLGTFICVPRGYRICKPIHERQHGGTKARNRRKRAVAAAVGGGRVRANGAQPATAPQRAGERHHLVR